MEIDSKPEEMDRKERRLIQLKIQREALKKEKDAESKQRLADLQEQIDVLEREYSDLEEVWKAEKATLQGATRIKEQIEAARLELEAAQRKQDFARMSGIQYGTLPELEKQLAAAQAVSYTHLDVYKRQQPFLLLLPHLPRSQRRNSHKLPRQSQHPHRFPEMWKWWRWTGCAS